MAKFSSVLAFEPMIIKLPCREVSFERTIQFKQLTNNKNKIAKERRKALEEIPYGVAAKLTYIVKQFLSKLKCHNRKTLILIDKRNGLKRHKHSNDSVTNKRSNHVNENNMNMNNNSNHVNEKNMNINNNSNLLGDDGDDSENTNHDYEAFQMF
eukprot:Pgem_evm1s5890